MLNLISDSECEGNCLLSANLSLAKSGCPESLSGTAFPDILLDIISL
jgi:hypothetical protein